jgi:hypothetical protein
MPTRQEAIAELEGVFEMIAAEYSEKGLALPADRLLGFERQRKTGSHERWTHPDGRAVTIPIHGGTEIGPPSSTNPYPTGSDRGRVPPTTITMRSFGRADDRYLSSAIRHGPPILKQVLRSPAVADDTNYRNRARATTFGRSNTRGGAVSARTL